MYRFLKLVCILVCWSTIAHAQEGFPFGKVTRAELQMTQYEKDTTAVALVLNEHGYSFVLAEDQLNLVLKYHVRIKVLKPEGADLANVSIDLYKKDGKIELVREISASSFNLENGQIKETTLDRKQIIHEASEKRWDAKKFAIPNVRVGSVIEYEYELITPYFYQNWRPWEFQWNIPKLKSEYCAVIPANWRYNIALRGPLQLSKNEASVLDDHFTYGGNRADCAKYMWAMENIPAFYEEDYMTSKKNFLSAITFELIQLEYFDGRKDKVTKEWKDVDQELKVWDRFGVQLRRGKDVGEQHIQAIVASEADPLERAKKVFDFIRHWYQWNGVFGYSSENLKKAFESKKGSVGDINLSLVAALRLAKLSADPMLLSTRNNGLPTDLFPVLNEFNYVIAKVDIGDKSYLLDATDDFLPFGLIPQRCLNGRGRVFAEKGSYWYDLKPMERAKRVSHANVKVGADGSVSGSVKTTYMGYSAAQKRMDIYEHPSPADYVKTKMGNSLLEIPEHSYTNLEDIAKALVEDLSISLDNNESGASHILFNPFLLDKWARNPFRSLERTYPVDFGVPLEEVMVSTIEYPEGYEVTDLPKTIALALPNNGGRFLFQVQPSQGKVVVSSSLLISRAVYSPEEYHYLKELFNHVVKTQATDLVFEKI